MSDFFLYFSDRKKINIDEIADNLSSFYVNPVVERNILGKVFSININNPELPHLKQIYSEKSDNYLWIYGNLLLTEELKNQYSLTSYIPDEIFIKDLFEINGINIFKKFSGWFNVIKYSAGDDTIEIINSRLGMLPLYYYSANNELIISSRLKIFYKILDSINIDRGVIIQQCLYNYPFSNKTHIKNVSCLPSASKMKIINGRINLEKYWKVEEEITDKPFNVKKSTDFLDDALNSVIKKFCSINNKIALSLTGGWDGRLILAYALKYKEKDDIILYSFGKENSPDVTIPAEISAKYNLKFLPVYLDNNYLNQKFADYAGRTILNSDSYRSFKRTHYLYAMDILKDYTPFVVTGIGGSNLLKSTAFTPSNVFNKLVLDLINTDDLQKEIESQYSLIKKRYSFIGNFSVNDFVDSFDIREYKDLYDIKNFSARFCTYLVSNIERKYFGAEVSTYRHLIYNYSPFLDYEFLQKLFKTSFFGRYDSIKVLPSFRNAMLYSKLISRNNNFLAKEKTDRNIDLNNLWNPVTYFNLFLNSFKKNSRADKKSDLYNTNSAAQVFTANYGINIEDINNHNINSDFMANYISAVWYLKINNYNEVLFN